MIALVPNPVETDEHRTRYLHADLAGLDEIAVAVELRRIESALMTSHRVRHVVERDWLRVRHARLKRRLAALRMEMTA